LADIENIKDLPASDQLALAGMLRLLVRLDGKFSAEEQEALEDIALEFGQQLFWQLMDEAGRKLPDDAAIREAALGVSEGARALVYDCVLRVAQSDTIQVRELDLLDFLRASWKMDQDES
jgi:hypothetical protein